MNRNTKHPDRPGHKRKPRTGDRTRNNRIYRITATWNTAPNNPITRHTADRAEARRLAREFTDKGMYVVLDQHRGNADWRTLAEYDGPALAYHRRAERREQAAAEARAVAQLEAERRAAATEQATRARRAARRQAVLDRLARVMVMPPRPPRRHRPHHRPPHLRRHPVTGCAPAALAALRAALIDAHHTRGPHTPEDDAQHVIDTLTRDGWRITRHPTATTNDPHA